MGANLRNAGKKATKIDFRDELKCELPDFIYNELSVALKMIFLGGTQ